MIAARTLGGPAVLASVGAAALPCPVMASTASGLETEAFGLVYFLGASFLAPRAVHSMTSRFSRA